LAYLSATDPKADKALPVLQKAVAVDAENAVAWNNLGSAYEQTDQLAKAKDAYQKAISAAKASGSGSDRAEANLQTLQEKLDKASGKSTDEANAGDAAAKSADSAAPAKAEDAK
jgi:tetratricopeptide (TPR) repeat protein